MYGWLIGGLTALDLGIKQVIEDQEDETFPRDLPCANGRIMLYKNHNSGFPFGVLRQKPELVKGIPLMVVSALVGGLVALMERKDSTVEKIGLAVTIGGALSNLYDRIFRGYVVDYFSFQWKGLKKVVFNLGDMFIFFGAGMMLVLELIRAWKER